MTSGGAAWNTKKKTPEEEWFELVIMKNEYCDILTTEECLMETTEEKTEPKKLDSVDNAAK